MIIYILHIRFASESFCYLIGSALCAFVSLSECQILLFPLGLFTHCRYQLLNDLRLGYMVQIILQILIAMIIMFIFNILILYYLILYYFRLKLRIEMIDFGKLYCNLHPQELITNFCNKDECLIGLCANCICTHTQSHVEKGTSPDYQNIRLTYKKAQQSLRTQVGLFEKDKSRIDSITSKAIEKRLKVKEIISIAKQQVSVLLGDYFEAKQKNMMRQIESQEKKYGLHCENRLEGLNSYIAREVSNLISAAQQLSSNNFLQSLPRIRTQYLVNSAKLHSQLEEQIQQNQKFTTAINCNKEMLPGLIQLLDRAIVTYTSGGIPFAGSSVNRQNPSSSRPKSLGKGIQNVFSNELGTNGFSSTGTSNERNAQSQINFYPPSSQFQSYSNNSYNIPKLPSQQYYKNNNYLSQIPQFKHEKQTPLPKVSILRQNQMNSGNAILQNNQIQQHSQNIQMGPLTSNMNLINGAVNQNLNLSPQPRIVGQNLQQPYHSQGQPVYQKPQSLNSTGSFPVSSSPLPSSMPPGSPINFPVFNQSPQTQVLVNGTFSSNQFSNNLAPNPSNPNSGNSNLGMSRKNRKSGLRLATNGWDNEKDKERQSHRYDIQTTNQNIACSNRNSNGLY